MMTVNIHETKTRLSALLVDVARGHSFVIARAGNPVSMVVPFEPDKAPAQRVGFLKGACRIPADFDDMGLPVIEAIFGGAE
ncbi:MAG: type II toxin-antitoxin system prevent-host-death family antitoxin [Kiritimatiellae bacterium]|nr:type II toxin-antitoxin system prevent-host-death family antitoxin [Kiritimatiellia bacterium]MDD3543897.1 type II toxin-antitoxin system prevent-host-death family antitoxin [Kiritimatiellia bacterium]MDD4025896.1 type II toxin-antitoxin system prevent-host-death family antitoxin [Kiritimatiellia bacterium]